MRATKAIIRLDNLRHNLRLIKSKVGEKVAICMAVKADAYGHGAIKVSQTAIEQGVKALGVATVAEGEELRQAGISAPIFLFNLPCAGEMDALVKNRLIPFCTDERFIKQCALAAIKQEVILEVHLKIDTGMGRIGCSPEAAPGLARLITSYRELKLGGVCTHFPISDSRDSSFTQLQIELLQQVIQNLKENKINPGIIHAANSGAIIDKPESFFDMVRAGIILYGYYPSHEQKRSLAVKPVMELKTEISFIKKVAKDTSISYGRTYFTNSETYIATLPIGYGDGYSRLLSNRGNIWIAGKRYPLVGRVCMDQVMVDLGPHPGFDVGQEVTLFGAQAGGPDAEEIADLMGTIPYEVTCLIAKRVPRIYIE